MTNLSVASLDSFQLIVAVYLFYVAAKGHGNMYRFGDLPEGEEERIRPKLRLIYFICGLIALAETGVCMLQNSMFTLTLSGDQSFRTQNFQIEALPFLSYELLSTISSLLSLLVILILGGTFAWLFRHRSK